MSNSTIENKIKGLEERFENEMRIHREGGIHNQGGLGASRPGSGRRPRPPAMFPGNNVPSFPPRSPQATETEHRMREAHKVSGKLNVNGIEYRSHVDDLQQLGELGSGTCGHVVKMLHKPSGTVIAVKQMRRSGNSEETKRILMDLDVVVRSHGCPYIVRCLGCFVTDADVWICMELMASCFDKLIKRLGAPIPETILGKVTVATVKALSYLKDEHGVIHRDVKPSNILLDECGNVKLCDFGISGRLVDSKAKTRSAGCAAYMAPERIDPPDPTRPDYDIRADVWSLGISLVELATGVFPYRDCQNDFEVLTRVIADDPPKLPEDEKLHFSPEFKSFVSQCLTKNYLDRPKYAKLLKHPFVVNSMRNHVSVGAWYAALPGAAHGTPGRAPATVHASPSNGLEAPPTPQPIRNFVTSSHWTPEQITPTPSRRNGTPSKVFSTTDVVSPSNGLETPPTPQHVRNFAAGSPWTSGQATPTPSRTHGTPSKAVTSVSPSNGLEAPPTPQPIRNFVTSSHWTPEQVTPTPSRPWWATAGNSGHAGGSSSQPASLETDFSNHSPYQRRRTIEACASPPPPARRVSADSRWRASPQSSGNTSPIVLQRFYHQSQQRRSRVDLHATPRHRSLSREHSTGRSPEPPPRTSRQHHLLGHEANGSMELEPPALHERLHPASPLLLTNERLSEGRSQSLTRAELRNGLRCDASPPAPPAAPPALEPRPRHARDHHDDQGWLHSLAGLVKRRLSGYVKWHHVAARPHTHAAHHHHNHHNHHRWGNSESWSMPASPLPPRAPPPRPAD